MIEIVPNWHPIFTHFPIAMVIGTNLCFAFAIITDRKQLKEDLFTTSKYCLWLGALFSLGTVGTGLHAYYTVAHDAISHQSMTMHRNWGFVTSFLLILTAWIAFYHKDSWGKRYLKRTLAALCVLSLLVVVTGYYGGETVYRYGSGVLSLPKVSEHSHADQASSSDARDREWSDLSEENHAH